MEKIIREERLQNHRQKLRTFNEQIKKIDDINTYHEIQARVNEYIDSNKNLTQKEVDNFVDFLNHCSKFYNI